MSIENILLFGSLLTLLIVVILSFMYSKRFALINGAIFITYVSYMLYGMFYQNQEGATLVWWFYLIVFMGIQLLIMLTYIITNWIQKGKNQKSNSLKIVVLLIGYLASFWGLLSFTSHYPYPWVSLTIGSILIGFAIGWLIYDRNSRI